MAAAEVSAQLIDLATGLDVVLSAVASTDGIKFKNPTDERTFVVFENTNGSTRTAQAETVATSIQTAAGPVPLADKTRVIPATTGKVYWGPFPAAQFNDADGFVTITVSATAGLTAGVVRLGRLSS